MYDAILETIVAGNTEIPSNNFLATLAEWKRLDTNTRLTPLNTQFKACKYSLSCIVLYVYHFVATKSINAWSR